MIKDYDDKYGIGYITHLHVGFYDPKTFPVLFREDYDFTRFGLDRLKSFMFLGQELLTNRIIRSIFCHKKGIKRILDCGAGYGATAIYVAENYQIPVVALTVSSKEGTEITKRAHLAGVEDLIKVEIINVLALRFTRNSFDSILAIESFCQIGATEPLLESLNKTLKLGGILVVSDYFFETEACIFKTRFDKYWGTNATTLNHTVKAAIDSGFRVLKISDITFYQQPHWRLNVSRNQLKLRNTAIDKYERESVQNETDFYKELYDAFRSETLFYKIIVLQKI